MRVMAIDYGDARIGLAVSDLTGLICGEAWTMQEWNMERASARITEEAKQRDVGTLVLGLPKNMDGMLTLVPGEYDTDGFFICRLRRKV